MKKRLGLVLTALLAFSLMVGSLGCTTTTAPTAPPAPKPEEPAKPVPQVLRWAVNEELTNVDIFKLHVATDRLVAQNVYSGLVKFKPGTTEIIPDLAERWEISPDGKTYTFYLRQGVKWHHGYGEFTSTDVKFTLDRHQDPQVASLARMDFALIERVEAPEPYKVIVHLKDPFPPFLFNLAWQTGFMASKKAYEDLGAAVSSRPIGTGPFQFDRWVPGEVIVLTANKDYYLGAPKLERLEFKVIPEELVALLALERSEVDGTAVRQLGAYRLVLGRPNIQLVEAPSGWMNYAYINTKKEPTSDVRVRQALAYAMDVRAMAKALDDMVIPNPSFLNPIVLGWTDDLPKYEYNVEKAKSLLKEAGYPDGIKIRMIYVKAHLYEEFALMLKDYFSKIGEVELVQIDRAIQAQEMRGDNWHVGIWAVTRLESDLYATNFIHSKGPNNYSKYSNPVADQLAERARIEQDRQKRAELYVQLQKVVAEDVPILITGTQKSLVAVKPYVKGLVGHPFIGLLEFYPAYIDPN